MLTLASGQKWMPSGDRTTSVPEGPCTARTAEFTGDDLTRCMAGYQVNTTAYDVKYQHDADAPRQVGPILRVTGV